MDVVILAGDIHRGVHAVRWAERTFPATPVVLVPGNYEYYRRDLYATLDQMRSATAQRTSVRILDNETAHFGDVRIFGATLWTAFGLYSQERKGDAMRKAGRRMNDFQLIRVSDAETFTPADSLRLHGSSRKWQRRSGFRAGAP